MRPRQTKAQLEQRRRKAVRLLKRYGVREVARQVGVSPGSVERWKTAYEGGGARALRAKPDPGSAPKLTATQQTQLVELLLDGPRAQGYPTELWTLERVAHVIERTFGVHYHTSGVWRLLGRLGWSCQKPERAARERDEDAIRRWRRVTWPKLRKRSRTCGAQSGVPRREWVYAPAHGAHNLGTQRADAGAEELGPA